MKDDGVPVRAAWSQTAPLVEAVRKVAKEKADGVTDVAAAFGTVGKAEREKLFVADRVRLSPEELALTAETVLKSIGIVH